MESCISLGSSVTVSCLLKKGLSVRSGQRRELHKFEGPTVFNEQLKSFIRPGHQQMVLANHATAIRLTSIPFAAQKGGLALESHTRDDDR